MARNLAPPTPSSGRDLSGISQEALRPLRGKNPTYSNQHNNSPIFCVHEPAVASAEIQQKEDAAIAIPIEDSLKSLSFRGQSFPSRPEYVSGAPVKLRTNYFEVVTNPKAEIYRYIVSVNNLQSNQKRKKPRIIELLLKHEVLQTAPTIATDFAGLIVTSQRLILKSTRDGKDYQRFDVHYQEEGASMARPDAQIYKVDVESDGVVSLAALTDYLNKPFAHRSFDKNAAITAINTILTWTPAQDPTVFSGAKHTKFYPLQNAEEVALGSGLIALKGYFASARTSIGRLLVNINVCTSSFVRDGRVDLIMQLFRDAPTAEAFLTKRRITTDYMGSKSFKIIRGFGKDRANYLSANNAMIPDQRISVAEFFVKHYRNGKPLINGHLPVLDFGTVRIHGQEVPIWIPPEECRLVPGQSYGKKLTSQQTTTMLEFAALPPAENARRIVSEADRVLGMTKNNRSLRAFGLEVDNKMIVVSGRKLKEPTIRYQKRALQATNGSWNLKGTTFAKTGDMGKWSFLRVLMPVDQPSQRKQATAETINEFRKVMALQGFRVPPCTGEPSGFSVNINNDWDHIDQQLEKTLRAVNQSSVSLLLVILDRDDAYVYSRIKFLADLKAGIHTVCAVGAKMLKKGPIPSAQYIANLALKFNLKLGGINHFLPPDRLGFLQKGNTMVMGIDVTHPSPGQLKDGPSIAAVVASVDRHLAQWPCSLRTQRREFKGADEILKPPQLGPMVSERLDLWMQNNKGTLPERILVYRDGVSESQYEEVLRTEVSVIYEACARKAPKGSDSTLVAFVVVGKRHHTRFYPQIIKETDLTYNKDGNANPQPGTVVDRGITMEMGWDFFLQAHDCLKGTAKPAHYVVLRNDFKDMGAKVLENITHDLCYMFGRATRSVSVVPPARYADLACERAKFYLYKYLTIRPDRRNENDSYDPNISPWTRSVHEGPGKHPLVDSMFYI